MTMHATKKGWVREPSAAPQRVLQRMPPGDVFSHHKKFYTVIGRVPWRYKKLLVCEVEETSQRSVYTALSRFYIMESDELVTPCRGEITEDWSKTICK